MWKSCSAKSLSFYSSADFFFMRILYFKHSDYFFIRENRSFSLYFIFLSPLSLSLRPSKPYMNNKRMTVVLQGGDFKVGETLLELTKMHLWHKPKTLLKQFPVVSGNRDIGISRINTIFECFDVTQFHLIAYGFLVVDAWNTSPIHGLYIRLGMSWFG